MGWWRRRTCSAGRRPAKRASSAVVASFSPLIYIVFIRYYACCSDCGGCGGVEVDGGSQREPWGVNHGAARCAAAPQGRKVSKEWTGLYER